MTAKPAFPFLPPPLFVRISTRPAFRLPLLFSILLLVAAAGAESASAERSLPVADPPGVADVTRFGAAGDGRTDDSAAFELALREIAGEGGELLLPPGNYRTGGIRIPENVTVRFRSGASIYIPRGDELRIDGRIEAGISQIFTGDGRVTGAPGNLQVFPQWFGARGDGVRDDAGALQKAADLAAESMGFTLFIPDGEYLFERDLHFRSNIESRGLLIKRIEIDEERTQFSNFTFVHTHHPVNNPHIFFAPDHEEQELAIEPFFGLQEGDFSLPVYREVELADGSGTIDLAEGGTIRLYSSDFFSSRNNQKGDQFYDRNDISQLVSGRGDIFPELAFSYHAPPQADAWSQDRVYRKGDYVARNGEIFKATWPTGPGTIFEDRYLGTVSIGPVAPEAESETTSHPFVFDDGSEDSINVWRRVRTRAWYRPKDRPVTVNGFRMEIRLEGNEGQSKRINAGAVNVNRSNMTFHNPEITVRDREATISRLLNSSQAVNNEFNNGYFSGATYHGLGYNILNFNVANIRYYNTVSVNSRKGLDGRHGKNITIIGGHFGVIDDHYGRNYVVRDLVVTGRSTDIPGYVTPDADLQQWGFRTIRPLGFSGANFHVENVTIDGAAGGILAARGDIGDLYGTVVLRNVNVRGNEGDVRLFHHEINPAFDFAGEVRVPDRLLVEEVHLENPGRLILNAGIGFGGGDYGPVTVRSSAPIGEIRSSSSLLRLDDCELLDTEFELQPGSRIDITGCTFRGTVIGLNKENIGRSTGNLTGRDAVLSFPAEYLNPELYFTPEREEE